MEGRARDIKFKTMDSLIKVPSGSEHIKLIIVIIFVAMLTAEVAIGFPWLGSYVWIIHPFLRSMTLWSRLIPYNSTRWVRLCHGVFMPSTIWSCVFVRVVVTLWTIIAFYLAISLILGSLFHKQYNNWSKNLLEKYKFINCNWLTLCTLLLFFL